MSDHYILNEDHSVSPAELTAWARWFGRSNRRVAQTTEGEVRVSTVFLGINHSFGEGPPLIFETMAFKGTYDELLCWRYSTWEQAQAGHESAVALVNRYVSEGKPLAHLYEEPQPDPQEGE